MVFAKHLRVVGDKFRNSYLQSTDEADRTHYKEDWTQMKVEPSQTVFLSNVIFSYWICVLLAIHCRGYWKMM